jgi:transposase
MSNTELLLKSEPPRRLEVFTGTGRRRQWTSEQKARIIAECNECGASVSGVARRHGLTAQQLFAWRRDARRQAEEAGDSGMAFAPVVVESGTPIWSPGRGPRWIEVVIGAATVRIPLGADIALEAVFRAVKGVT